MAKAKELDKLAQDAIAAQKAGMSYGKYKAMQDPVAIKPKPMPGAIRMVTCRWCGKEFPLFTDRYKVFCDDWCRNEAWNKTKREQRRMPAEQKREEVFYIVYLAKDDTIVATGNEEECAKQMGRSVNNFRSMVCRVRQGKIKKYRISSSKECDDDGMV